MTGSPLTSRRIVALAAAIVICAIGAVLSLAWVGGTRTDVPVFAEQYQALVESYQRDAAESEWLGDNRWDLIGAVLTIHQSAATAAQTLPAEHYVDFDIIGIGAKGTPEARENTLAALRDLEEAGLPKLLDEIAKARRFVRPAQDDYALNWLLPELGASRWAVRACGARLRLAMEGEGGRDVDEAARAFEHIMALSRVLSHDPVIISHLVSCAIGQRGLETVRDLLMEHELDAREIRLFQQALVRQTPKMPLLLALEGDALMHMDSIRMVYDNPDMSPSQAILALRGGAGEPSRARAAVMVRVELGGLPSRELAIATSRHINEKILAAARRPSHEIEAAMREVQAEADQIPGRAHLVHLLMPSLGRITSAHLHYEATLAGMQIMLALELHRAERGEYPPSLEALEPEYLESLARDPYTGDAFIYRTLGPAGPGEGGHGRRYILYSTGPDQTDDGGRAGEWTTTERRLPDGTDLVINRAPKGEDATKTDSGREP